MGLPDKVIISADTIADLAKHTLVPIRCDAPISRARGDKRGSQSCGQELCCWKAFCMHSIKKHSSKRKTAGGITVYKCLLNKCSASNHSSSADLKTHVEASHMKGVSLPCPFANCTPPRQDYGRPVQYHKFLKERDLVDHLESEHSALLGHEIDLRDRGRLLPSWDPRPPIRPLPAPPDLPLDPISSALMRLKTSPKVDTSSHTWLARAEAEAATAGTSGPTLPPTPTPFPSSQTPRPSQGRKHMLRPPDARLGSSNSDSDMDYDFDDLPVVKYDQEGSGMLPREILSPPHFLIQRVPGPRPPVDLVCGQRLREMPVPARPSPPPSIFYPALRDQVYASYASGEDAMTDSLAPP